MFDINNFYDLDGVLHLNKYKIVVRYYDSVEKQTYEDVTMFLNDEGLKDMKEQHIAKHQLLELISEEVIDTSDYDCHFKAIIRLKRLRRFITMAVKRLMKRLCHKHRMNLILIWTTECLRWN